MENERAIEEMTKAMLALLERLCSIDDRLKELDDKIDTVYRFTLKPYSILKRFSAIPVLEN